MTFRRLRAFVILAVVALMSRSALGATVTVAWNANVEAGVAGYVVQYGDQSGIYQVRTDVGAATTLKIDSLVDGKTYYFVVQAYSADRVYSPLSTEITAYISTTTTPVPPVVPPGSPLGVAQFTVVPGGDGHLDTRNLAWTPVADAQAYYLYVGSAAGLKDVVDSRETQATAWTLPAVASEQTLIARLWTQQSARWRYVDMPFMPSTHPSPSRLITPTAGQQGVSSAQLFQWEPVALAQAYYLSVGTSSGARDIIDSGETTKTAWRTASLPAGLHLFARISTKMSGTWYAYELQFDSAPAAVMIYPYKGASDTSTSETFMWTGVTDAENYLLYVGTSLGAHDIIDSGALKTTSVQVSGMKPDVTLYASVSTQLKGVWVNSSVAFTTSKSARLLRPLANDGSDLGQGIAWTTILGADAYAFSVGSSAGAKDLMDTGEVARTDVETPALPAGQPLFARIATKYAGVWTERLASLTLLGSALVSPVADGDGKATVSATGQVFTWTPISNATAYYLYVGTQPGLKDLVDSRETPKTTFTAKNLPLGVPIYVTLWTKANGLWRAVATTFVSK